ncbi:MAG TPA: rhodanese-like domain-containing protein [Gaiellaceae bacterium]|nr:rhodanese-like domain-containing protein [Gaiellaceae bacterium]
MTRTTIHDLLHDARKRLSRLEPAEALEAQRAGALLIDIRSSDDRNHDGCIPGSLHIPRTVLEWRLDPDAHPAYRNPHISGLDQRLVLVCSHGFSSSLAAATLQELGFIGATDMVGGFVAWRDAGLPVRPASHEDTNAVPGMGDPGP